MPKNERVEYICDRCGTTINDNVHSVGKFHYMHVFKWYAPGWREDHYPLKYICEGCWQSFKAWYEVVGGEEEV